MRPHLSFLGVPLTLRPAAATAGLLSALAVALLSHERRAALATVAALTWYAADAAHVAGHIVSSQAAGAPLDAVDFGIFPISVYERHDVTPQQHIGRACGGVLASLVMALALAALARATPWPLARRILTIAAAQNGLLLAASLLPLRIVDGGVIYANLRELRR